MAGRFKFEKLFKYPHMQPEDVAVWDNFVANNPQFFDTCDYDVPVGTGAEPEGDFSEALRAEWTHLTRKKIDVIGYRGDQKWIVEVKPTANARGLGQLLTYSLLYRTHYPHEPAPFLMLVCAQVQRYI